MMIKANFPYKNIELTNDIDNISKEYRQMLNKELSNILSGEDLEKYKKKQTENENKSMSYD